MSFWGKVVGGAAGFAMGGPLGALIGAVMGHAVDRFNESGDATAMPVDRVQREQAFAIAVIVLGAKMAKADGQVTRDEIAAFRRVFTVPESDVGRVARIFDEAKKDARGFEPYARQIAALFQGRPAVLEELLNALLEIAYADGAVGEAERRFLSEVAQIFGLDPSVLDRLFAVRGIDIGAAGSPYAVLGVSADAPLDEVKTAYRRLAREHHPDRLVAEGLPEEMIQIATRKIAGINEAYDRVLRLRGAR